MRNTGKFWYRDSRRAVKRIYGEDWKLFCGLIAATSPNTTVKANTTLARKAYAQIKATGTVTRKGYLPCHYSSIQAVLDTGEPNGRKCRNFYRALIGNENAVVIDLWMMRYAGIDKRAPSKRDYDRLEEQITSEALVLGITPAQHQAMVWSKVRGSCGGYAEILAQGRLL